MSLWSSYRALSPKTRLLFGLGLMTWAGIGIWTSPHVEDALGMVPTKQEQEELERKLTVRISSVDREQGQRS
ncbi:hypothetical protein VTN00DRAFT_319 [Thermoascus crustaceus]|uniref:uncharacterized protein n=1 Tax=Thermoascus crustaceus TaxID=5088 RepID=UPI00374357B6